MGNEERIIELLEILVKAQLSPIIIKEFKDAKLKKIYELTGKGTARELGKKLGVSRQTISNVWMRWEQLGLIKKDGKTYKKIL